MVDYVVPGMIDSSAGALSNRNKIINGAMQIDQRNAGASNTPGTGVYTIDRWHVELTQSAKFSIQQNAGSVTPPAGFTNYLGATSLSAYSVTSTDYFIIGQAIEGFNCADLAFGTASAQTITLSFWVRSSLTGTFGGTVLNSGASRNYPFTYTISAANTWEQKTVTISGDTTGTWLTNSGAGLYVRFCIGAGASVVGAAGSWSGTTNRSVTGQTSVVGTNGATWYITGVQVERGSVATAFEYRSYQQELMLCQRYYETSYDIGTAPGAVTENGMVAGFFSGAAGTNQRFTVPFKISKRSSPTVTGYDAAGNSGKCSVYNSGNGRTDNISTGSRFFGNVNTQGATFNEANLGSYSAFATHWTAAAEL